MGIYNLYWEDLVEYARKNKDRKITTEKATELLTKNGEVGIISWDIHDVFEAAEQAGYQLSEDDAKWVLEKSMSNSNAETGTSWDDITYWVRQTKKFSKYYIHINYKDNGYATGIHGFKTNQENYGNILVRTIHDPRKILRRYREMRDAGQDLRNPTDAQEKNSLKRLLQSWEFLGNVEEEL